jgi:hypothetical protein
MVKKVAERWLWAVMYPEYRFQVLYGSKDFRNMASLMSSFRDGRITMEDVPRVADLGIKDSFDGLELWSKDRDGLVALQGWYEKRGFETTGIW